METYKLGEIETKFAKLIWAHAPIASGELVKLCERELCWKKSTTYTMLRRLVQRGIFENNDSVVTTKISQAEFAAMQSKEFVEEAFDGSLPAFLAAFTSDAKLTQQEIDEIRRIIERKK
nr:BlaI/MecI/CopY family transcriptional regulator [bacterium]